MIAEESLRDKESLCDLHTRLHEALKCYYELRGKNYTLYIQQVSEHAVGTLKNF